MKKIYPQYDYEENVFAGAFNITSMGKISLRATPSIPFKAQFFFASYKISQIA